MLNNDFVKDRIERELDGHFIDEIYWSIIKGMSYWTCGLTKEIKDELYAYSISHVPETLSKETRNFLFSDEVLSFFYRKFKEV